MLKWLGVTCLIIALNACGIVYISPGVDSSDDDLRVMQMTPDTVRLANQFVYQPKQVPDVYFRTAGSPTSPRGPGNTPTPSQQPQERPTAMVTRLPPAANPGPYRIGVGDVVLLATKSSGGTVEELTGLLAAQNSRKGYTVQDDGAIAVPEVGRVPLADLTLEEAEAQLFQTLLENQIDPTFSLEIAEFNARRVSLGGAVARPTILAIDLTPLFLNEALTRAGGIATPDLEFASIRLYRDGSLYQIPLAGYLGNPDLQKLRLVPGDSVFVDTNYTLKRAQAYFEEQITLAQFRQQGRVQALAELNAEMELRRSALTERRTNFQDLIALDAVDRDYVYLTGEVTKPGRFAMPFGRQATLADALYAEGGFLNETGNPSQIYVLRGAPAAAEAEAAVTAWHLDARKVTNLVLATQFNLRPNDIVFIAEQPVTKWSRVIQQTIPSVFTNATTIGTD